MTRPLKKMSDDFEVSTGNFNKLAKEILDGVTVTIPGDSLTEFVDSVIDRIIERCLNLSFVYGQFGEKEVEAVRNALSSDNIKTNIKSIEIKINITE